MQNFIYTRCPTCTKGLDLNNCITELDKIIKDSTLPEQQKQRVLHTYLDRYGYRICCKFRIFPLLILRYEIE